MHFFIRRSSISQDLLQVFRLECPEHDHLIDTVPKLRREFAPGSFLCRSIDLAVGVIITLPKPVGESISPLITWDIFCEPRFEVRKITEQEKSTRRLPPRVNITLSR